MSTELQSELLPELEIIVTCDIMMVLLHKTRFDLFKHWNKVQLNRHKSSENRHTERVKS